MATRASIEFDFNQALKQARRLEELAASLTNMTTGDMQNTLQNISVHWKGERATEYLNQGQKLKSKINDSAAELNQIAYMIRVAAKKVYAAEMEALTIAETRIN